ALQQLEEEENARKKFMADQKEKDKKFRNRAKKQKRKLDKYYEKLRAEMGQLGIDQGQEGITQAGPRKAGPGRFVERCRNYIIIYINKLGGEGGVALQMGQVKSVKFQQGETSVGEGDVENGEEEGRNDGNSLDASSCSDDYDSDEPRFVKVPMTPEQLEARKLAKREERRKNKEEVKASQALKRTTKMKKKDKKRQISKSKGKKR
ncbi:hypothetical protein TrCOL_g5777, partial [Triparma columacea]